MSSPRIAALVCEGQTDVPILRTVVQKLWPEVEEVRTLQPALDSVGKAMGPAGWSQVRSWCQQHAYDLEEVLEPDLGDAIDLLVIALDMDIALQAGIEDPPAEAGRYESKRLRKTISEWLLTSERKKLPAPIVVSTPVMAVEAWVISALFPKEKAAEQIREPAEWLAIRKKIERSTKDNKPWKSLSTYQEFAKVVGGRLNGVRKACMEAERTCAAIENRKREIGDGPAGV